MVRMYYGIDLGTTNTVVTKGVKGFNGILAPEVIQIVQYDGFKNPKQDSILPSVLYVDENNQELVGAIGKDLRTQMHNRTLSNTKRFIGTTKKMVVGEKSYSAKDVAKIILMSCKKSMERYGMTEDDGVTITVPASFNTDQIKDTMDAAKEAGFKNVNIIPEPTAALIDFINHETALIEGQRKINFDEKKRILVFDLGGGTCDVAVVEVLQKGNKVDFTEVAIGRYDELGGIDFDMKAAKYLLEKFCEKEKVLFEKLDEKMKKNMINSLKVFSEKAKESISMELELGFSENPKYKQYLINFYNGENIEFSIDKEEYDKSTANLYERAPEAVSFEDIKNNKNIVDPILNTLKTYKIDKKSIDLVFLTGGMSKYRTIKEKIMSILELKDDKVLASPYPLDAVARGAAIYQYYDAKTVKKEMNLTKNSKKEKQEGHSKKELTTDIIITKVMAGAVMIDIAEGMPVTIIEANKEVPCKGTIESELFTTSPSGVTINLYEGKNQYDWQMKLQKSRKAMFRKPVKLNTPIDVNYEIDENKYLTLSVKIDNEEIILNQEVNIEEKKCS